MAVEAKRGCGYRKVNGLYLVSDGIGVPCGMLPFELTVCPCCGEGVKQTRGWTWINPQKLFALPNEKRNAGGIDACVYRGCHTCPISNPPERAGLTWIGAQFYPKPEDWMTEGRRLGFSRRIKAVPRGFKLGEDWVFVAHPKAVIKKVAEASVFPDGIDLPLVEQCPGIFHAFKPTRIEKIITDLDAKDPEIMADLEKRGITPVVVPHNDPDHQGTCYDKEPEEVLL